MNLEQYLVLNRYMHRLFGAESLQDLKSALYGINEGRAAGGESYFYGALIGRVGLDASLRANLLDYDRRIMDYELRLSLRRNGLKLRYFQYLALLYSEVYLDMLSDDPALLVASLNAHLDQLKGTEPHLDTVQTYQQDDLRRVAFFMATGSGKTLLMHAHLWQLFHYLEHGAHPEALVPRADGRRSFRNVLLITPNEGLSAQHLDEFRTSGIPACHILDRQPWQHSFEPQVLVVEIHKLAEQVSGEGVSIALESLSDENLVLVDEGHKGTGSEAQTWKSRQKALSSNGFLLEYSATFSQAIGAASAKDTKGLLGEYGKAILFDYSYRHFHGDGYGKAFQVLNISKGGDEQANDLLVAGLLTFYEQLRLFRNRREAWRAYNIEPPLWVFVGSSVSAVYMRGKQAQSDVATVLSFLAQFLADRAWATATIDRFISGDSQYLSTTTGLDLFAEEWSHLRELPAGQLYEDIARDVFHGYGALEVCALKTTDGEFGLRTTAAASGDRPGYFGVVNIGDGAAFSRHLRQRLEMTILDDEFTPSLFTAIDRSDSGIHVLLGAKKFIEGWSSWRVSCMGLLNIGKGQGSQVIQLFGRGVRLKGLGLSLKRSNEISGLQHPEGLNKLETLRIFGWNADYIAQFRQMIEREGLLTERQLPVRHMQPWPSLPVPVLDREFNASSHTWRLQPADLRVTLDLRPRASTYDGTTALESTLGHERLDWPKCFALLDWSNLYLRLLEHKALSGYGNIYIDRDMLRAILTECTVYLPGRDHREPLRLQQAASLALRTYLDRYYAQQERATQGQHIVAGSLQERNESVIDAYTLRIDDADLLKRIDALLASEDAIRQGATPLPRLNVDFHLYNPLLWEAGQQPGHVSASPPALNPLESSFVETLNGLWREKHNTSPYSALEIYLLRNLPRVGIGFFARSGFYPDFVLWVRNISTGATRVVFVEPHGMHHGGLSGNADKIEALRAVAGLSDREDFRTRQVTLDGYLITHTEPHDIPGAEHLSWAQLRSDYRLLRLENRAIETLILGAKADG